MICRRLIKEGIQNIVVNPASVALGSSVSASNGGGQITELILMTIELYLRLVPKVGVDSGDENIKSNVCFWYI